MMYEGIDDKSDHLNPVRYRFYSGKRVLLFQFFPDQIIPVAHGLP
jgi:hypothetical protein